MAKPDNRFQMMAAQAARRLDAAAAIGDQLALLPPDPAEAVEGGGRGRGRGKAGAHLGKWLAAQGYRDPGEVLADLAGLGSPLDPVTATLARVEQVAAGIGGALTTGQRLALFQVLYGSQLRALDALLPYTHARAEAPAAPPPAVHVHVSQAPGRPGDGARVVNPGPDAAVSGRLFAPPPMPGEMQQNQGVEE